MPSSLIPIRVDVVSDDKSTRIVETLLFDPSCWPIPLSRPLSISVEANIKEIAHTILSESETNGMGRTVRHFVGRMELWTSSLQDKIEAQLRPQLWKIVDGHLPKPKTPIHISLRLVVHSVVIHDDILWDPNLPITALDFAKDMARDLKLPDEAVVAIATTILEQTYGMAMDKSADRSVAPNNNRGAWIMDSKDYVTSMAHVVAQHRPMAG